ncbi:BAM_G0005940.mRNA.1.CDS.1 [Saccharomyces cerevisiae]|nr:BAM_G0005940.mRNA.1.CDS.1 [Saccharomyces cerevisiae]CAI7055648.1 BAM_G0005940.mRNA.1.CDS.1 [Saccharomyces cerevisiae]
MLLPYTTCTNLPLSEVPPSTPQQSSPPTAKEPDSSNYLRQYRYQFSNSPGPHATYKTKPLPERNAASPNPFHFPCHPIGLTTFEGQVGQAFLRSMRAARSCIRQAC